MIIGRKIIWLAETTSTMDDIERLSAQGEAEGVVVVADFQSQGRGRSGRQWAAKPGSALLCSILLRPLVPPEVVSSLPLHVGVAVAEAIDSVSGVTCTLKWPNDVLIDGKKVAGILMTSRLIGRGFDHLTLGLGINLRDTNDGLAASATSIEDTSGKRIEPRQLLDVLLPKLDEAYQTFLAAHGRPSLDIWTRRAAFLGERVIVEDMGERVEGNFEGVDDSGALFLRLDDGTLQTLVSGEFVRGPRRPPEN